MNNQTIFIPSKQSKNSPRAFRSSLPSMTFSSPKPRLLHQSDRTQKNFSRFITNLSVTAQSMAAATAALEHLTLLSLNSPPLLANGIYIVSSGRPFWQYLRLFKSPYSTDCRLNNVFGVSDICLSIDLPFEFRCLPSYGLVTIVDCSADIVSSQHKVLSPSKTW